jgi:hypothetical protein
VQAPRKLSGALAGALAVGGDPATSPLYVFGPFLRLIVPAGVAYVTFGASIWLVVLTVVTVSIMYRSVMAWVTDGTGGSGLSEEEFGSWAGKVNASITFIEYSLTFLVSISALVTFLADRLAILNTGLGGLELRLVVGIAFSMLTGHLVNRGPRTAAVVFGPATAGVLLLLWLMMGASVWRFGLELPGLSASAFSWELLPYTLGGYARILALMTGIEVFANLVAAYEGPPEARSRKAFGSLLIVMGSTAATMLIVGPAVLRLADPTREDVSVFTQTMDALLPAPLAMLGTAVGVAVLLSASAAALQGIQHLAHGLGHRHFVPAWLADTNRFGVANRPVSLGVLVAGLCFVAFGTREETYLALYAAGVFVLLSMTGWAAARRIYRDVRTRAGFSRTAALGGAVVAAGLTSAAMVVILAERFLDGVWLYFALVPVLYAAMSWARRSRGAPTSSDDRRGRLIACTCPGVEPGECDCAGPDPAGAMAG